MSAVASLVPGNLFTPVGGKLVRPSFETPAVPKVTVNEYCEPDFGEDDIRFARKPGSVDAEAVSAPVQFLPNSKLHFGVPTANPRHRHTPLFGRHVVSHGEVQASTQNPGAEARQPPARKRSLRGGIAPLGRSTRTKRMKTVGEIASALLGSTGAGSGQSRTAKRREDRRRWRKAGLLCRQETAVPSTGPVRPPPGREGARVAAGRQQPAV